MVLICHILKRIYFYDIIAIVVILSPFNLVFGQKVVELSPLTILSERDLHQSNDLSLLRSDWDHFDLEMANYQSIDDILGVDPSFSFYRRQNATFANPTTQGVSLRNIGATAVGRSLVVYDGVPQNDPFGGWVPWARFIPISMARVALLPSSLSSSWGSMTAGGVVLLNSDEGIEPFFYLRSFAGEFDTYAGELAFNQKIDKHTFFIEGKHFHTDGDFLIHPNDRGVIDQTACLNNSAVGLKWNCQGENGLITTVKYSFFEEQRNNGSPLTGNSTKAEDFSVSLSKKVTESGWKLTLFKQFRMFENTFTSINAARDSETLVNDQFNIPAQSWGINLTRYRQAFSSFRFLTGVDMRLIEGETNEDVGWGLKTRRRAGGMQQYAGAFLSAQYESDNEQVFDVSIRVDYWRLIDGFRVETIKSSREVTRDELYLDRNAWEPSASMHYKKAISKSIDISLGASRTFRLPTVNELYRPFRVRNDITESNPDLNPEHFFQIDWNLSWNPISSFTVTLGGYEYWIDDAIANVYIFDGPRQSIGGFIPSGGTFNQKNNISKSRVSGLQTRVLWVPCSIFYLNVQYLYSDARFLNDRTFTGIDHQKFPQIPHHKIHANVVVYLSSQTRLNLGYMYSSTQFDDALNSRALDEFQRVDLSVSHFLNPSLRLFFQIQNLTDEIIQTGVSSNGLRSVAPQRRAQVGFQWSL